MKKTKAGEEKMRLRKDVREFELLLREEEKSEATIEKYVRDVRTFLRFSVKEAARKNETFTGRKFLTKELCISYKDYLQAEGYQPKSINSMLVSLNRFLDFLGKGSCKVKCLRLQSSPYLPEAKNLTRDEYLRLLKASENDRKLQLILETICATGIRVSELQHFTAEAVRKGEVEISCKGKIREILIPKGLQRILISYCEEKHIQSGMIFATRTGKPVNRSNIWKKMKELSRKAGISPEKVYPHNLRKLFAKSFYRARKDLAKLADVLGHSSIDTTRIYIMETSREHRKIIESLRLII